MTERSRTERSAILLENLEGMTPSIEASAIVSTDKLMVASAQKDAKSGLVLLDMKRTATEMEKLV